LFLTYDPDSKFDSPERRILIVDSLADPYVVGSRIAFSRRVGRLIERASDAQKYVMGTRVRTRNFDLTGERPSPDPGSVLEGFDADVDLNNPDYEISTVQGKKDYLALTRPGEMRQGWSKRRPRCRAFFHPSAIFPKLSRALVNMSRFKQGEVFLDPFCGTGSLCIEATEAGAQVVASDISTKMAQGSLANMKHFRQDWLGVIRADAFSHPMKLVDAVATDIPYGRASSVRGKSPEEIMGKTIEVLPRMLKSGSRLVLMHPSSLEISQTSDLELEEEHRIYVHKLLTRTITVLRRI